MLTKPAENIEKQIFASYDIIKLYINSFRKVTFCISLGIATLI